MNTATKMIRHFALITGITLLCLTFGPADESGTFFSMGIYDKIAAVGVLSFIGSLCAFNFDPLYFFSGIVYSFALFLFGACWGMFGIFSAFIWVGALLFVCSIILGLIINIGLIKRDFGAVIFSMAIIFLGVGYIGKDSAANRPLDRGYITRQFQGMNFNTKNAAYRDFAIGEFEYVLGNSDSIIKMFFVDQQKYDEMIKAKNEWTIANREFLDEWYSNDDYHGVLLSLYGGNKEGTDTWAECLKTEQDLQSIAAHKLNVLNQKREAIGWDSIKFENILYRVN